MNTLTCISHKRVFPTAGEAQTELDEILEKAPQRPERRFYLCNLCGYFHLTKQDKGCGARSKKNRRRSRR